MVLGVTRKELLNGCSFCEWILAGDMNPLLNPMMRLARESAVCVEARLGRTSRRLGTTRGCSWFFVVLGQHATKRIGRYYCIYLREYIRTTKIAFCCALGRRQGWRFDYAKYIQSER